MYAGSSSERGTWISTLVVLACFYKKTKKTKKCTSAVSSTDRSILNFATSVVTVRAFSIISPAIDYWPVTPLRAWLLKDTRYLVPGTWYKILSTLALRSSTFFLLFFSLLLSSLTRRRFYPLRASGQAVVTGVYPSPPRYAP